jgi:TonB family protein
MERAQRQANNVLRWIKVHSEKPRANPATAATTPAAAPSPAAKAPPRSNAYPAKAAGNAGAASAALETAPALQEDLPLLEAAPEVAAPVTVPAQAPPPAPPPVPASIAAPTVAVEPEIVLVPISQAQPELSRKVQESMNNDRVTVRFTVLPSGSVINTEILKSSNRRLNTPTLDAVSTWRFQPIRANHTVSIELAFKD